MSESSVARTWPPERFPTAEEWRDWFVQLTREEQVEQGAKIIADVQIAYTCFVADHEAAVEHVAGEGQRRLVACSVAWQEGLRAGTNARLVQGEELPRNPYASPAPAPSGVRAATSEEQADG